MAELVDVVDLGSTALRCVGSSPTEGNVRKEKTAVFRYFTVNNKDSRRLNKNVVFVQYIEFYRLYTLIQKANT